MIRPTLPAILIALLLAGCGSPEPSLILCDVDTGAVYRKAARYSPEPIPELQCVSVLLVAPRPERVRIKS